MWGVWSRWSIPALLFCKFLISYSDEAGIHPEQYKPGPTSCLLLGHPSGLCLLLKPLLSPAFVRSPSAYRDGRRPVSRGHGDRKFYWLCWNSSSEILRPPLLQPEDRPTVPFLGGGSIHGAFYDNPVPRNARKVISWVRGSASVSLCPCISVCSQCPATGYWTRKVLFTMLCVLQMCRWWSCGSCVGFVLGWWRAYKYLINMYSRWPGATQTWFMKASSLHTGLETTWFWSVTLHAWLTADLWVVFSF